MDANFLRREAANLGIQLSDSQVAAFEAFEAALYEANQVMNLTRVSQMDCALRHFLDSLLISPFIPQGSEVLDIGTGPGFPAWPLACARPDLQVVAVDSSGKMLGFLKRHPLPNLKVVQGRMEDLGWREMFDVVTGRAVAPLTIQLELSAAATKIGGAVIPMRSAADRGQIELLPELDVLGLHLDTIHVSPLANTGINRLFPVFRKTQATSREFPRPWADMKRNPL